MLLSSSTKPKTILLTKQPNLKLQKILNKNVSPSLKNHNFAPFNLFSSQPHESEISLVDIRQLIETLFRGSHAASTSLHSRGKRIFSAERKRVSAKSEKTYLSARIAGVSREHLEAGLHQSMKLESFNFCVENFPRRYLSLDQVTRYFSFQRAEQEPRAPYQGNYSRGRL